MEIEGTVEVLPQRLREEAKTVKQEVQGQTGPVAHAATTATSNAESIMRRRIEKPRKWA
jgi:hypothetical protein